MAARSGAHAASETGGDEPGQQGRDPGAPDAPGKPDDELLLAALLDGMDAALCAFDADGAVTHWNREAERLLGWTRDEAVGRRGLAGWAVRTADAPDVEARLLGAMRAPGRRVHECALLTKDGGRVLVRIQSSGMADGHGRPTGVYCAFSEVHAQVDLERSIALSESLIQEASWGVVLVDADLRPAAVNAHAAHAFRASHTSMLGRPLGELVDQGLEELEGALQHVLAEGVPPAPAELWLTLRTGTGAGAVSGAAAGAGAGPGAGAGAAGRRRCWRCGFLRLASPLAEEPVPLGVAWFFHDVTQAKRAEQEAARVRFRDNQLHRAARAAAECEDPLEAATVHLDFALAGFADHALLDLALPPDGEPPAAAEAPGTAADAESTEGPGHAHGAGAPGDAERDGGAPRLARAAAAPSAVSGPGPGAQIEPCFTNGLPVGYPDGHPALQAAERCGAVRTSSPGAASAPYAAPPTAAGPGVRRGGTEAWAAARKWPPETAHGLCTVLRSRGRTLGVLTFLRTAVRDAFDRGDAAYAEDVALRVAAAVDLARSLAPGGTLSR